MDTNQLDEKEWNGRNESNHKEGAWKLAGAVETQVTVEIQITGLLDFEGAKVIWGKHAQ